MLGGASSPNRSRSTCATSCAGSGTPRLLFVKRPERRAHKRRMLYVGSSAGEERFYALEFDHHDDLVGYDFASALLEASAGRRGRAPALRRLHPWKARPLLREVRTAAVRPPEGQVTPNGSGSRPTWRDFEGNIVVLPEGLLLRSRRRGTSTPSWTTTLTGSNNLELPGAPPALRVKAAELAVREETGSLGVTLSSSTSRKGEDRGSSPTRRRHEDAVEAWAEVRTR